MISQKTRTRIKTSFKLKILIVLITIILIVIMFPKGESLESEVSVGSIWIQDDLIASKTFEILKNPELYESEKQHAIERVHKIFVKNPDVPQKSLDSMQVYSKYFRETLDADYNSPDAALSGKTFLSASSLQVFRNIRRLENLLSTSGHVTLADIFNLSKNILARVYKQNLLNIPFSEIEKDSIAVRDGKFETILPKRSFLDPNTIVPFIDLYIRNSYSGDDKLIEAVKEYILHFTEPNLIFSNGLTEQAKMVAAEKISKNVGFVNENERIVAKHDRITPEIKAKIDSYKISKGEETGLLGQITQQVGKFLHIVIILTLFSIYIFLFRKKIYGDNLKILLICIVILLIAFITFIVSSIKVTAPVEYLIIIPVASMLITIIFDSRIGFYTTIVASLIAGGLRGNDYAFVVTNIIAGGLAAYTVRDIKNRSQIFRSFIFILVGYIVSILAFGLERYDSIENMLVISIFAVSNALISPVFTYGLIIFFERAFRITTDLTLLELTDFNSPLLKNLSRLAPGTFSHCMTIGSLVETAAQAIGANPILSRVGAYYHDIGKTLNPHGFVENQLDNKNIHEKLDPKKSAQMIIDHVNEGIKLAVENKLPKEIVEFIPMHHGTMVVSYFYQKAKEEYGEENVNIDDYRYPGPKPNSKETALLMLADACESTVRSMTDPDPKKVENVINNLINARISDGQLDESPLTFRDLKLIRDSFQNILIGQHHKRIRYPNQDAIENDSKDQPE